MEIELKKTIELILREKDKNLKDIDKSKDINDKNKLIKYLYELDTKINEYYSIIEKNKDSSK
jgi:hypothetical protein